jgi:flagellar basal body-associated protein FliL
MAEKKEKIKGKGRSSKIIIIVLVVILVFSVGFSGYLFFIKNKADDSSSKLPTALEPAKTTNAEASTEYTAPYKYSMEEFLVNLADEGGKRYFKVKLTIGYDTKKTKEMTAEFEEKADNLRDSIISVLRAKKSTELVTQKNIDDLKKDILIKINPIFENGKAYNIYFTDILIQ